MNTTKRPIISYLVTVVIGVLLCLAWIFGVGVDGAVNATFTIALPLFLVIFIGAARAAWVEQLRSVPSISTVVLFIALANLYAIAFAYRLVPSETRTVAGIALSIVAALGGAIGIIAGTTASALARRKIE